MRPLSPMLDRCAIRCQWRDACWMSRAVAATAFGGPEVLAIIDVDDGLPGPGQISVDVRAAGVNPADAKSYGGVFGRSAPLPMRVGMEASGVVTAVGEGAVGPR